MAMTREAGAAMLVCRGPGLFPRARRAATRAAGVLARVCRGPGLFARARRAATTRAAGVLALASLAASCQAPQWPVRGPLASPYGFRMEGMLPDVHRGLDIAVPVGTPVLPLLPGRVRFAGPMSGYGQVVWVDHSESLLSVYAHLSEVSVAAGREVDKGTVLGKTGQSGAAAGPHLHLEVWRWGREVDPVEFLGGPPGG